MDTMPRMTNGGRPIIVPFAGQTFVELCRERMSPQAIERRVRSAEAHLMGWNDPHEVELPRLYAEQKKHQLAADRLSLRPAADIVADLERVGEAWRALIDTDPERPTDAEIDAMAEEYETVTNGGPKLITPVVNRLIGLLETQNCDGYEFDRDDDDDTIIHGSFHFHLSGAEADTLEAYFDKELREQEEEFQRELPEIKRQLAEIRGKA